MKIETCEDLERIVARQDDAIRAQNAVVEKQNLAIAGLGELVKKMDATVRAFATLLDSHQKALEAHGLTVPERPKKTDQVN